MKCLSFIALIVVPEVWVPAVVTAMIVIAVSCFLDIATRKPAAGAAEKPIRAIVMVPAGLVGDEPLTLEAVCEPSRVYEPDLECRAVSVERNETE